MPAKREIAGFNLPITVGVDKSSVSKALKDLASFNKSSQQNIREIQSISNAANAFSKNLSKATKESVKQLQKLGDELRDASEKAEELESAYGSAGSAAEKSRISEQLNKMRDRMAGANKAIEDYRKTNGRANREFQNTIKGQQKYQAALKSMASYSGKDTAKGAGEGLLRALRGDLTGGLSDVFQSVKKGVKGKIARRAEGKALDRGGGDAEMAAAGKGVSMAMGGFALGAGALVGFVKLLGAASEHMTGLNKSLLSGVGTANEFGSSAQDYAASIKRIRNAAIDASGSFLKFGGNSETAMQAINAYTKEASGSIIRTEMQLKNMGGDDLGTGIQQFTQQALVYGKALGMEVTEVTGLMGKMVGEIGMDADSVQKTMGNIVKQASQAGMPVNKFMGIFKEAIPNLDLFTNRIEELTGTIKLLSKTMDPRAVKGFMQAFGKGFDQLDFKQRLKMALVVGPGEMGRIMNKDIKRASASVKNELPGSIQAAFDDAMKGGGNVKKMAKVAADAAALGVDGAKIANMTRMARYKENANGGVLKQASGMRDMGLQGRMEAMEAYANKFTGGDISGLGEHVVKQLGVSEAEYKAILDLKASMGVHLASVAQDGMTASASVNKNLVKIYKQDNKNAAAMSEDEVLQALKNMANGNSGQQSKLQDYIQEAATMQIEADSNQSKKEQDELEAAEDIAAENVNATLSIGDKIMNVIKVILEKIYQIIDSVLSAIGDLYTMLPNWLTGSTSDAEKKLGAVSDEAKKTLGPGHGEGVKYLVETNNHLKQMLKNGQTTSQILGSSNDLAKVMNENVAKKNPEQIAKLLEGVMTGDMGEIKKKLLMDALQQGDYASSSDILNNMGKGDAAILMSNVAAMKAQGMGDKDPKSIVYGTEEDPKKLQLQRRDKRQLDEARSIGDIDKRKLQNVVSRGGPQGADAAKQLEALNKREAELAAEKTPGLTTAKATDVVPSFGGSMFKNLFGSGSSDSAKATDTTAKATETIAEQNESAEKKADKDYQNTADVLGLLKKGIKFEQSWMTQKYKGVLKDASLDAFRPALAEYLLAYMRLASNEEMRKKYLDNPDSSKLDLAAIGKAKTEQELEDAIKVAKAESHAAGGVASYTGLHTLTAGERVLPPGQSGSSGSGGSGKNIYVGGIHISGAQNPQATANAVAQALDDIARRH